MEDSFFFRRAGGDPRNFGEGGLAVILGLGNGVNLECSDKKGARDFNGDTKGASRLFDSGDIRNYILDKKGARRYLN